MDFGDAFFVLQLGIHHNGCTNSRPIAKWYIHVVVEGLWLHWQHVAEELFDCQMLEKWRLSKTLGDLDRAHASQYSAPVVVQGITLQVSAFLIKLS